MSDTWPWLVAAGLGAFHGLNPAMGWLFAVALGLNRGSRAVVYWSLLPIGLGHAASVAAISGVFVSLAAVAHRLPIPFLSGLVLIGWAGYHAIYGHGRRVRVGLTTGLAGLGLWSFLMATSHGAGLMLLPVLVPLCLGGADAGAVAGGEAAAVAAAAIGLHTVAMLLVMGLVAAATYEWVGLAIWRRGWLNVDRLWVAALALSGVWLILS